MGIERYVRGEKYRFWPGTGCERSFWTWHLGILIEKFELLFDIDARNVGLLFIAMHERANCRSIEVVKCSLPAPS